jgi:hypothetical protein
MNGVPVLIGWIIGLKDGAIIIGGYTASGVLRLSRIEPIQPIALPIAPVNGVQRFTCQVTVS